MCPRTSSFDYNPDAPDIDVGVLPILFISHSGRLVLDLVEVIEIVSGFPETTATFRKSSPLFAKAIPKIQAIKIGNPKDQNTTPGSLKNSLNCDRIS